MKQKFVTEALGGCWHEEDLYAEYCTKHPCCGCSKVLGNKPLDLTTPDGTAWMVSQLEKLDTFPKMLDEIWDNWLHKDIYHSQAVYYAKILLNPEKFLDAVAHHLGYEEE